MSYHEMNITKHSHTSPYKLIEESQEFIDALAHGNPIMAIQELSDLYGCIKRETEKLGFTIEDLDTMSTLTQKVFEDGVRTNDNLLDYLKKNAVSIKAFGLGFIQVKINNQVQYNFYSSKVKRFNDYDMPHNHKQSFTSEILHGTIKETRFNVVDGEKYDIKSCSGLETKKGEWKGSTEHYYHKGQIYYCDKSVYHVAVGGFETVTKIVKDLTTDCEAYHFTYGHEQEPIEPLNEQVCWEIVESIISRAKL